MEKTNEIVENIQAIRISEIQSVKYVVEKADSGENEAELTIKVKTGEGFYYKGSVDQVRRRFDYLVNRMPDDTKEFLILSH